ncbi:MAG: hypothetical protein ACHREM_31580, partial [Polyangiales bacterium]
MSRSIWLGFGVVTATVLVLGCGSHVPASSDADASVATSAESLSARVGSPIASRAGQALSSAALRLTEHQGTWTATHPAQGFSTRIDDRGAALRDADGRWSLDLHASRVGRRGAMRALEGATTSSANGRVQLDRGQGVTEWFVHDARGLEHGIDVRTRPAGDGALVVAVDVAGLSARATDDGSSVDLVDRGERRLRYAALSARDANGRALAATMHVTRGAIELEVQD